MKPVTQIRSRTVVDIFTPKTVSRLVQFKPRFQLVPYGAKAIEVPRNAHGLLLSGLPILAAR